jgi:hypothetical protein
MANSTTHLRTIGSGQAQKEVTLNQIVDALSPAATYGRDATACVALTWGYFGGTVLINGTPTQVANGTLILTASATNYLEADPTDGSVSVNTTGFTAGRMPLYQIAAGANTATTWLDLRVLGGGSGGVTSDDIADAIAAHKAESDPHPQYLTPAEGDSRYAPSTAATGVSSVNGHTGAVTLTASDVGAVATSALGAANGAASLDGSGKLLTSQLPNLAIIDFLGTVANQTAMLALSGQKGDWCARSDTSTVYVITGSDPTQVSSWTALSYPTGTGGTVTSVNLAVPGLLYTVSGGPVTGAGTLTFALKTQAANTFLAGPVSGAAATPTMRTIAKGDLSSDTYVYHLTAFYPGVPTSNATVTRVPVALAVSFPANLAGSVATASVAATSSTVFTIKKNGSAVGTITFAAGSTSATFATTSGAVVNLAAGDIISVSAPTTADATLADVGIVLAGTR